MLQLTPENYYTPESNAEYMSVHQFQSWRECAAREWAVQHGKWQMKATEPMLVGSYVDAALTEPVAVLNQFCIDHASDVFGRRGAKRAAFETADKMVDRLRRDPFAMELLRGETQRIVTGELGGCAWKGKVDVLKADKGIFVDLKTCASFEWAWRSFFDVGTQTHRNEKVPWYDGYWFQLGVYRELLRQNGFDCLPIIVAVTKQAPPDIGAWTFEATDRLGLEVEYALSSLGQVLAYKRGDAPPPACGSCDYCRHTKTLSIEPAEDYRGRATSVRKEF